MICDRGEDGAPGEFVFGPFVLPCLNEKCDGAHYHMGKNVKGFVYEVFWRGDRNGIQTSEVAE